MCDGTGKASAVPLSRNPGPVLTILENISVCGVEGSDDGMKIKKTKQNSKTVSKEAIVRSRGERTAARTKWVWRRQ